MWVKRDDKTADRYGGSKVRKLEWIFGDAVRHQATRLLTVGAVGSNFVLAAATHGRTVGIEVDAIQFPRPLNDAARRSIRAAEAEGLRVLWAPSLVAVPWRVALERARSVWNRDLRTRTYVGAGGSSPRGVLGFVEAGLELRAQIAAGELPEPRAIFLPAGTGGSMAGLLLGCRLAGLVSKVVGVRVVPRALCPATRVVQLANRALDLLRSHGLPRSFAPLRRRDVTLLDGFVGAGYGAATPASRESLALAEELERLPLDTTYTGKALSGMLAQVLHYDVFRSQPILFWNTYCPPRSHQVTASDGVATSVLPDGSPPGYRRFLGRREGV